MNPADQSDHHPLACRLCGEALRHTFVDLGSSPLCQRHITPERLPESEPFYPLHVYLCEACFLVQLPEYVPPDEIFHDYAYFSSYSDSWLAHARDFSEMVIERFALDASSRVVELASNDGYLLRNFVERNIPALGIDPAENVAEVAIENGVPTIARFFGVDTAGDVRAEHGPADLIVGNNVLAHVPDLNDFIAGMKSLLNDGGVISMEFPHLQRLIEENQFDTIYHEHFSYFSFSAAQRAFARHGLTLFDVQELPTHGGSLRIFGRHERNHSLAVTDAVHALRHREIDLGYDDMTMYQRFARQVEATKRGLLAFLIDARDRGERIVGYGAPGKGNTLLNYCGIRTDLLDFTVDRSPHKQGNFLPGTRIPIFAPAKIDEARPDYVLILPWNLKEEIAAQMGHIQDWGGRFVVPIPEVRIRQTDGRWLAYNQRAADIDSTVVSSWSLG